VGVGRGGAGKGVREGGIGWEGGRERGSAGEVCGGEVGGPGRSGFPSPPRTLRAASFQKRRVAAGGSGESSSSKKQLEQAAATAAEAAEAAQSFVLSPTQHTNQWLCQCTAQVRASA
jgi:hypothetical protein